MNNFILGVIFGVVVGTVGFAGIAGILDRGVSIIQTTAHDAAK